MNRWEQVTGSDLDRDWKAFAARAAGLPPEYQAAWGQIVVHLMPHGDFTGRNLTPIVDGILGLLEQTAADGQSIEEALGDDIPGFCAAVAGEQGARTHIDKWRNQLNRNVARKFGRLGA